MSTPKETFERAYPHVSWEDTDPVVQDIWLTAWTAALSACHKVPADQPRTPKSFTTEMAFGYERGWRKGAMAVRDAIKRLER